MKPFIQANAEDDILRQFQWYSEQGLPDIANRFREAIREAIQTLVTMPGAGAPKHIANPRLAGLRTWPVQGFDEFRVYYLAQNATIIVLRVLHGKRDIGSILAGQAVDDEDVH